MELILALLTYLTATLTPVEFLISIALAGLAFFLAIRWTVKNRKSVLKLLGRDNSELTEIKERIETLVTKEDLVQHIEKLEMVLRHELSENDKSIDNLTQKFVEISALRHEIIDKEFDDLREQSTFILSSVKDTGLVHARLLSQIENLDSSFRAGVVEFRGYHRELGQDLKLLGRDLALIERSFDLRINNGSAVKLR